MNMLMAEKEVTTVRLVVSVKEINREALRLEAILRDVDMGDIIDELIESNLGSALAQLQERRAETKTKKPKA